MVLFKSQTKQSKKGTLFILRLYYGYRKCVFNKGYRMLTLGWSDGYTFMPIDFSLVSSMKYQINEISEYIDKRTYGYRREMLYKLSLNRFHK